MLSHGALLLSAATLAVAQWPSYAPAYVQCPSNSILERTGSPLSGNQSLFDAEASYLRNRRTNVLPNLWQQYLQDNATGSTGYNVIQIVQNAPNLGIAVSGGGLRASLYGSGVLSALDNRNSSTAGGLLQLANYLSGLSGGSWTVSSLALNDLQPIYELVTGVNNSRSGGWMLDKSLVTPDGLLGLSLNGEYLDNLGADVSNKSSAGFPVSITDLWGRALAYHFFNETNPSNFYDQGAHDQGLLFSSIRLTQNFQAGAMPVPILVTTSRSSEQQQMTNDSTSVIPLQNTAFEISPFTFGSFDPTLSARIPIEYLGTQLSNGQPRDSSACVKGFENAGFMIGTSASLFNAVQESFTGAAFGTIVSKLLQKIADLNPPAGSIPLVANYPNSFGNFTPDGGYTFESSANEILQITDGGEDGSNVPLYPLLVKARAIDTVFAIDGSADVNAYANGTSLIATSDKVAMYMHNYTDFPPIPATQADFAAQGLITRPTFFGCNSTTGGNQSVIGSYPLIVYLPNSAGAHPGATNYSTFKLEYSYDEVVSFLDAAHEYTLRGFPDASSPNQPDKHWPLCLKCAVVDRARARAGVNRTTACEACMNRYCWSDAVAESLVNSTQSANGNTGSSSSAGKTSSGALPSSPLSLMAVLGAGVVGGVALLL
ncbi:AMP-binding domain-containing protein [Rhodotorula toruloides]|uniref:Lysophospholipase n=1 Tax=Rhodotorula toruloides TaxID=5286 RepID=A0A511K9H0_RHOTO|nr:AMP-binding domain-containing protein [Rhodotorula toruloides]